MSIYDVTSSARKNLFGHEEMMRYRKLPLPRYIYTLYTVCKYIPLYPIYYTYGFSTVWLFKSQKVGDTKSFQ